MYRKGMKALAGFFLALLITFAPYSTYVVAGTEQKTSCSLKPVIVAVIDTGLTLSNNEKLCKTGHKDFSGFSTSSKVELSKSGTHQKGVVYPTVDVPADGHGHGTNIAGLIYKHAGPDANYCLLILKYWQPGISGVSAIEATIEAINYATEMGAKYINYSGGGIEFNEDEAMAVSNFLDHGGTFIAAAGNEKSDLAKVPYYPAMDDNRVIVVGNGTKEKPAIHSNFGVRVDRWENGVKQVGFGHTMTGTSQAAAIVTGKMLKNAECQK